MNEFDSYLKKSTVMFQKLFVLFFSQRKNADELKVNLEKCVIPIFCTAMVGAEEDKKIKLTKV